MLLGNLVNRRVSEENASNSSPTRRVTKQGLLLLAALDHRCILERHGRNSQLPRRQSRRTDTVCRCRPEVGDTL